MPNVMHEPSYWFSLQFYRQEGAVGDVLDRVLLRQMPPFLPRTVLLDLCSVFDRTQYLILT